MKRTALYEEHQKLGGRLIDFGGWELPVQYSGVKDEHLACRTSVGIFDVSHMGEIFIEGSYAERFLNYLITNDVRKLQVKQALYSAMCFDHGGIVDDLVVYRRAQDRFLVVVNASNTKKDFEHMRKIQKQFELLHGDVDLWITDESAKISQIAIQGRNAIHVLQKLTQTKLDEIQTYWFTEGYVLGSNPAIFGRTGYTGEDGFEIYLAWDKAPELWRALLKEGEPFGIKPCGLGARDTLRLEMKYPLYGHELNDETSPIEAGLAWVVKMEKGDFIGKTALLKQQESGLTKRLIGFHLLEPGIPRQGYKIYDSTGEKCIGAVTSGTQSPSLQRSIGVGYVDSAHAKVGTPVRIEIRRNKISTETCSTPFYRRPYPIARSLGPNSTTEQMQ